MHATLKKSAIYLTSVLCYPEGGKVSFECAVMQEEPQGEGGHYIYGFATSQALFEVRARANSWEPFPFTHIEQSISCSRTRPLLDGLIPHGIIECIYHSGIYLAERKPPSSLVPN